eukprot:GHVU01174051.1.p1 GENE.GHVU01174051.1~~GHVU01174051.1.p1  ORF type:complete len:312 (+),score=73.96 GHVU01174051.1:734-1669(+)
MNGCIFAAPRWGASGRECCAVQIRSFLTTIKVGCDSASVNAFTHTHTHTQTVELDDMLNGAPTQHREVMLYESPSFLGYFPSLFYLDGGIDSGFRQNEPEKFEKKLYCVRKEGKTTRVFEIELSARLMSHGDSFILDAGREVYVWHGQRSHPFERSKASQAAQQLATSRKGLSVKKETEDDFFKAAGFSASEVPDAGVDATIGDGIKQEDEKLETKQAYIATVGDNNTVQLKKVEGGITRETVSREDQVLLVDAGSEIFAFVGDKAPIKLCLCAINVAHNYCKKIGRCVPVTRLSGHSEGPAMNRLLSLCS